MLDLIPQGKLHTIRQHLNQELWLVTNIFTGVRNKTYKEHMFSSVTDGIALVTSGSTFTINNRV